MPPVHDTNVQYDLAFDLNHSIKRGNKVLAQALLAGGAPVNGCNLLQYRPLTFTAVCGGGDLARLLIERGADLNAGLVEDVYSDAGRLSVRKGTTALTMAIRNCHLDVFKLLVCAGADLNASDTTGFTPLMSASLGVEEAEKGVVMAKALLRAGADPTIVNDEGCIALTYAAAEGSADVVDMLLAKAPKTVSHVTFAGATPLYGAVCHGNEKAVVRLLAAGAVQPARYRPSFCPLVHAVVNHERLVRILLRRVEVVGGDAAIQSALEASVIERRPARILHVLLSAEARGCESGGRTAPCREAAGSSTAPPRAELSARSKSSSLPGRTRRSASTAGQRARPSGFPCRTVASCPRRRSRPCDECCGGAPRSALGRGRGVSSG